jgi:NAD(P)-dependent dehydrogenase (short-subunit alcohol dehydrogenase family)
MSKTILITGTSSGFGKLMALTLAKEGHQVIACMRNVTGKNAGAAEGLNKLLNIDVIEMDVTSSRSVKRAVEKTLNKYRRIDVLVNNAGISGVGFFEATSIKQMKSIFEVNLWGAVRCIQGVLPSMRGHKTGLIINISSILGILSNPYLAPYIGSKYAIEGITESLQYEVRKYNIEAVTVLPGPFPTEIGFKDRHGHDKQQIIDAYGLDEFNNIQNFGRIMSDNILAYQADNQEVADAVKKLINLKHGTRPSQTLVNRMADGIEQELINSKIEIRAEWMKRMGFVGYYDRTIRV